MLDPPTCVIFSGLWYCEARNRPNTLLNSFMHYTLVFQWGGYITSYLDKRRWIHDGSGGGLLRAGLDRGFMRRGGEATEPKKITVCIDISAFFVFFNRYLLLSLPVLISSLLIPLNGTICASGDCPHSVFFFLS